MIELFQMWALVEVLGVVCLPLTITVCHKLPDRGWAFSKALGLVLFTFCVWLPLMYLPMLPFSQLFIALVGIVLLVLNLVGLRWTYGALVKMIRLNLVYILVSEAVFLGMVFLLGWLRSYGPDIRSFEMFMDEGFIAAIMRSSHLPPNDMWFSGYPINYYYYAHFAAAVLAKLLGQSPSIAFNTGISMFFGLTAVNLFGVTCNIVSWARHLRQRARMGSVSLFEPAGTMYPPLIGSLPYGFLTMIMGLILGNLAATQQWWFQATRLIDKTINEFPAFSFLLACFHAHVLALAFTVLAIGLAFNLFLEAEGKGLFLYGRGWRLCFTMGMTALVLGALFTMNGWDFPTYLGLTLACIVLQQWLAYGARFQWMLLLDIFTAWGSLAALSFLLYAPFYMHFISPALGLGIVPNNERSPLPTVILIYGLFAFVFLSLILASVIRNPLLPLSHILKFASEERRNTWIQRGIIGVIGVVLLCFLSLILLPNGSTFVVCAAIALVGVVALLYNIGDRAHAFTLLLGALAFTLVASCEIVFLKDVFAGNYPRMNTVFKFYFQAWVLLSIAGGAGVFFILDGFRPVEAFSLKIQNLQHGVRALWGIGLVLLLVTSAAYPLVAPYARYARIDPATQKSVLQRTDSLDGLTYLKTDPANPGDYAAIRWLNEHVQGDPVIIESIGEDYTNYGRVSAFTGLPTPMGWVGHEYQWRVKWMAIPENDVEFQRRGSDIDAIYTNTDANQVLSLMAHYHAQYLYVGPLEYAKYPKTDLSRFAAFMQIVYNAEGVTIYKVK
jgi:YYY domain-containing protein